MIRPTPPERSRFSALAVATGILASRLFGFLRVIVMARYFGTSMYADVFTLGVRLPNMIQNLLGEGTLSASFIPVYASLLARGRKEDAGRVAGAVLGILAVLAAVLVVIGIGLAPVLVAVLAPSWVGTDQFALSVRVVRWLFPMTGLLALSAWALGILNSHRMFLLSYTAPVVWNLAIIATFVTLGEGLGWSGERLLVAASIGALVGGGLQFLVQVPMVLRVEPNLRPSLHVRAPDVQEVAKNAGPAILGRGVVQLSGFLDLELATMLASGAAATVNYAQTIYMLPVSLFGLSVAAAELPELAREGQTGTGELRARVRAALEQVAFFVVPSTVALIALGDVVIGLLKRGAFGAEQVELVHYTLAAYAIGLPAATSSRVVSSAFYGLRDTRTPARIAMLRVSVSAVIAFAAMSQFEPIPLVGLPAGFLSSWHAGTLPLGPVGLAFGTGCAAWLEWGLLSRILAPRIGGLGDRHGILARMWVAALLAGAAGWGIRAVLPPMSSIPLALAVFGVFGAVYFAAGAALGIPQVGRLVARLARR